MGIFPGVSCWENEKALGKGGTCLTEKRFHAVPTTCQTTLLGEAESPDKEWIEPHLNLECLKEYIAALDLKFSLILASQRWV